MGSITFGTISVQTSSHDKILFPEDGITKGELIEYYRRIADVMVPHLRRRPLNMRRFPNGIGQSGFFQQEMPDYFPEWIDRIEVDKEGGRIVHVLCDKPATLVYLANQNMITPHVWLSRVEHLHRPDQVIFDLDPSSDDFSAVRDAAKVIRKAFEERGLKAYLMTTGSRGVHVRAPIRPEHPFDAVRAFAREIANELTAAYPDALTIEQRKKKRLGRIYLDVTRNAYGQTAVPPYAVRSRPGAPIATPLEWEELGRTTPQKYNLRNIFRRIGRKEDPWKNMHVDAPALHLPAEVG